MFYYGVCFLVVFTGFRITNFSHGPAFGNTTTKWVKRKEHNFHLS